MTVTRGFPIIVGSDFGFATGGRVAGDALAHIAPAYYRGGFSGVESPDFDPVQVGLGLSQGLIAGSVVVLAVSLSRVRSPAKEPPDLN